MARRLPAQHERGCVGEEQGSRPRKSHAKWRGSWALMRRALEHTLRLLMVAEICFASRRLPCWWPLWCRGTLYPQVSVAS